MSTKEKVLSALENADGNYVSGAVLAETLGISRNSVWKAVNSLKEDGFKIDSLRNNGYRLADERSFVYPERLQKYLSSRYLGKQVYCFKEVDSTNNYAKKLAHENAPQGTTVIAESQTAGKGRMGRTFSSPAGTGLYMSIILRMPLKAETAQLITSCAAVSVAQATDALCPAEPKIKWVNDIFINDRKICGILTEASISFETGMLDFAVVGMGINVYSVKDSFDDELLKTASSIEDECGVVIDRSKLCAEILSCFEKNLGLLENHQFIDEYRKRSCTVGNYVMVTKGNSQRHAYAFDIDDSACLMVRYDDGSEEALNSGEARIIKV